MFPRCPQCSYSLTGLPEEHQCPECGLRYDAASEAYRHTSPKRMFGGLVGFFAGSYGAMGLVRDARSLGSWAWLVGPLILLYFAGFAYMAYRLIRTYRGGPLVAVLPDGLYVRLNYDQGSLIAWADVKGFFLHSKDSHITVKVRGRMMPVWIAGVFKTKDDALRLLKQIKQKTRQSRRGAHDEAAGKP